ncbi:hypothetical protein GQX74_000747 [Glossina fuscipes]|nr:hypothetical protein GQX74_000747 [Glossina fuscipes]
MMLTMRARIIRDKREGFGIVSSREPQDFIEAKKEMDGRYVGSRPIKFRQSTWRQRSFDIVKKKEPSNALYEGTINKEINQQRLLVLAEKLMAMLYNRKTRPNRHLHSNSGKESYVNVS